MKPTDKQKGITALILLAFVYASMGLFVRYLTVFSIFQQLYLRLLAAVVLGFIVFGKTLDYSKLKKIPAKEWGLLILRAICYYLIGVALFTKAVLLTKISTVSFIGSLPTTAVLGFLILKEKVTFKKALYISLAFLGVLIISIKDFSSIFSWGLGEIIAFISVMVASYAIVIRKYHSKFLTNNEITQTMLILGFIFVLITSLIVGEGIPLAGWSGSTLIILGLAGFVNVALMFLTNYGFDKIKTSIASNILTLEMFFAVLLGFLFFREIPTIKEIVGAFFILISVIKMNQLQ
ncbi:MAG: DMT family transporter [Patescibacteria group bacterium]